MAKYRNSVFYMLMIALFGFIMYWVGNQGKFLEQKNSSDIVTQAVTSEGYFQDFLNSLQHNLEHPLAVLLIQIITIVLVARFFGWIFKKIGQPSVIGEIIAGIALGPSFFGSYFPELSAALFPVESLGNLEFLSQIGLILFMFVVGMELDLKVIKSKANDAIVISHLSIIIPFTLGMVLAYSIFTQFAPPGVEFLSFALFLGIAMSITAFPVLARIVQERDIHKTKLGTVVITAAAADDITAWCILAAVIAIVKAGSFISSLYVIALAIIYVLLMLYMVRPFLKRVADSSSNGKNLTKSLVAIFLITLIISAYATEVIGIHALFGAFMTGAIMPDNMRFRQAFIEKVEDVALTLFLPLFFVYTGLRTEMGLINDAYLWKITGLIILVAVVGKFIGSAFAAKFVGQSWKDSLTIGALMNTRGLMELVVLNIGFDLGVLNGEVFAMMVIMALVTTFMTGPSIDIINKIFKSSDEVIEQVSYKNKFKILFSFANQAKGKKLLLLSNALSKKQINNSSVTALLVAPSDEIFGFEDNYEEEHLDPVIEECQALNQKVNTMFKVSSDVETEIINVANNGDYDLLLVDAGESIFEGTLLGRLLGFTTQIVNPDRILNKVMRKEGLFENTPFNETTHQITLHSKIPTGILIDKNLEKIDTIIIPIFTKDDIFLIEYAQKFIHNNDSQVIIIDVLHQVNHNFMIKELIRSIEQVKPNHISVIDPKDISPEIFSQQDLMVVSIESWKKLIETRSIWLKNIPSVLIFKS
ncbi:cation:proton antiporter [Flavobacterium agricola]|uniref:Cation:proton antiporter n=1 Tax=Flavobacterium agricola TaxID=2870839 RepID=A0ABY6LXK5_9FLAO|nr:cation:proton antiporter [Flavobacterium agricola]UYW00707.1 cation:proton antiporter [Flavobacterium agricola]